MAISQILTNTADHADAILNKVLTLEKKHMQFFEDHTLEPDETIKSHIARAKKGEHPTRTELEALASLLRTMIAIKGNTAEKHTPRIVWSHI